MHKMFDSYQLGDIEIKNRIIMAPLTRCRAIDKNLPNDWMVTYYAQRASAGLIISEGSSPSPDGLGYANIPGLYSEEQTQLWRKVTDAVHAANGHIFFQMMHTGRIAHVNNLPEGGRVIGASAIAQKGEISTYDMGRQPYPVPHELSTEEVEATIMEYVESAAKCVEAGFDGVEIHCAHGYLPNQFINPASNQRTDKYGGSVENRCRFVLEIAEKMAERIGKNKVGIRISPFIVEGKEDIKMVEDSYLHLTNELERIGVVFMHLSNMGEMFEEKLNLWNNIRKSYTGTLILCGDFTKETAIQALDEGRGDCIAFGRDYIANPDLAERFKYNYPIAPRHRETWYTKSEVGYTDYPTYKEEVTEG